MSRQNLVVQVFVASPADVAEEREVLEMVIDQLNQIWSRSLGLTFELLKWETNVRPSFASDSQTVINDQIGIEYDVFIGIFWGRLGTETPRAASGSIEEFERAYAHWRQSGIGPEIMLYFKDAPISPSKLDPKQLQGIQDFKHSLPERGGLYSIFEDLAGFESSLRAHLSAVAQKFSNPSTMSLANVPQSTSGSQLVDSPDDGEYGYIDYIEIYATKMAEMTTAIKVINQATVRIGEQMAQHAMEFQNTTPTDTKAARHFVKRAADDMDSYAEIISNRISTFSTVRVGAFSALSNALALRNDFTGGTEDLCDLRSTLVSMAENTQFAQSSIVGMRTSIEELPRISKELNKAKRAVVSQLDTFVSEIDNTRSTIHNIIEAIDRML